MPVLPRSLRQRLAEAATQQAQHLSDKRLANILGDEVEDLADRLAQQEHVPYEKAARALNKALRQARHDRLGIEPSRSGTKPGLSVVLTGQETAYVARKAKRYGSRAAVVHAALALLREQEP